ncbi:hypothetical protein H0H93_004142 [Arthromyces matolae]|nr:hypothetical protein H0H93_004142 [Arthromyces matolae]
MDKATNDTQPELICSPPSHGPPSGTPKLPGNLDLDINLDEFKAQHPEGETPAWGACGRIVSQERADFFEFVACNIIFAAIALVVLFARSKRLQLLQARQLAARIGVIRNSGAGVRSIPAEDGTLTMPDDPNNQTLPLLVSLAHENGVKALVSIGGYTGSRYFSYLVAPANRTAFVNTCSDFLVNNQLDGLDFDWEFPNAQEECNVFSADDTQNFFDFIHELRAKVGQDPLITLAVNLHPYYDSNGQPLTDVSPLVDDVSHIAIMAYDIFGPWVNTVGPNAPLDDSCAPAANRQGSALGAVQAWTKANFPANKASTRPLSCTNIQLRLKIVLGVPAYGHSFGVTPDLAVVDNEITSFPTWSKIPQGPEDDPSSLGKLDACGQPINSFGGQFYFAELISQGFLDSTGSPASGIDYRMDNCSQTVSNQAANPYPSYANSYIPQPFVYNSTSQVMVAFDDATSFASKGRFIEQQGLKGFAIWDSSGDYQDILLDSISEALGIEQTPSHGRCSPVMPELRASERLKNTAAGLNGPHSAPAPPTAARSTSTRTTNASSQRKRPKTSHKSNVATRRHKKGQLGLLAPIIDMPLDILYEVFSLLLPVDLLQLCRANKSLRKILLDRRATPIWKAAFTSLEFPPPAMLKDMSYPGYALLIFGEECHRLTAEGWGDELNSLSNWEHHRIPGADKAEELNERIWKKIRPEATAYLQRKHAEVLARNRRYLVERRMHLFKLVYTQYLKDHSNPSPVIRFADLCVQEPFLSLIFTTPATTEVTLGDFEAKQSHISGISQVWFESRSRELKDLLPPELPSLDLAVAIFRCVWCKKPISFPRMLRHYCLIIGHDGFKPANNNADIYEYFTHSMDKPWNFGGNQVLFDKTTSDHAQDVVALCGAEPLKATATFMDELDCRLECLRCLHGKRSRTGRLVMPWSYTIVHEIQKHRDEDEEWEKPHWRLVENPQEIEFVKKRETFPYPDGGASILMSSKHIYRSTDGLVLRSLRGAITLNPALKLRGITMSRHAASKTIYVVKEANGQTDDERESLPRVAVISGGGAGHEPAHAGYTGHGMLSAAVSGDIFSSPSAKQIQQTIYLASSSGITVSEVDEAKNVNSWKDVLVVINNYTGDRLNFGLAIERAIASSLMKIESVIVADDVSRLQSGSHIQSRKGLVGARGLAGNILVCKILGACAQRGADLTHLKLLGDAVVNNLRSVGVGLDHCHVPGREARMDSTIAMTDEEYEIGLGLHNEPGVERKKMDVPEKLIQEMLGLIMQSKREYGPDFITLGTDNAGTTDETVLFLNNLGGLPQLELAAVLDEVITQLASMRIRPKRIYMSAYMTSLNAPGFSISILNTSRIDQELRLSQEYSSSISVFELLDDPTDAASWVGVRRWPGDGDDHTVADSRNMEPSTSRYPAKQDRTEISSAERCIRAACNSVILCQEDLTEFDTILGDGDCGETFGAGARAQLGDRTLVDALFPFCKVLCETDTTFEQAVEAAKRGVESTRMMYPVLGRAAYVTVPSRLTSLPPDPGAYGVLAIVEGIRQGLEKS